MQASPDLRNAVSAMRGIGPSLAQKLQKLGIESVEDLLYYFPRAHEDRREIKLLSAAKEGERATFRLRATAQSSFYFRGKRHPRITVSDSSGTAYLYCFNRDYFAKTLSAGKLFYLTGTFSSKRGIPIFSQFDIEQEDGKPEPGIVPQYRLTAGLSQKMLRRAVANAIAVYGRSAEEGLPEFIRKGYAIKLKAELIKDVHFPHDMNALRRAREALSYEEFFKYQIVVALARNKNLSIAKKRENTPGILKEDFIKKLGFRLTDAQKRVLGEIEEDLRQPRPMNRLIQGDVGCGKTVVALIAALEVIEGGGQAAFMAPTEILARQHYLTMSYHLASFPVNIGFISGAVRGEERRRILEQLRGGEISIAAGTHALFSEDVEFKNLSLAVIDEQQKFGVLQRGKLRAKGLHPDCIVMTATPIPRTLSMTLYGDLDVSIIDEMPPGRAGVETFVVRQAEIGRVYEKVRDEVSKGRQAYFIYPIIEESLASDMKNALDSYEHLKKDVFPEFEVGLLHGRMDDEEKDRVMAFFKDMKYKILVSTSVVEVGVDVPNATVMVIEQAERFGLSSIHQLRGRIGRGEQHSYCFLVPDRSTGREAFSRLMILKETSDGFKIAEWDLKLRGPGEVIGKRQSGVPGFVIEDLDINTKLIYRAQKDARAFISGAIGPAEEREKYLTQFTQSEFYKNALLFFGG